MCSFEVRTTFKFSDNVSLIRKVIVFIYYFYSVDFYRFLWISVDVCGFLWISVDFYEFLWISVDFSGSIEIHGS